MIQKKMKLNSSFGPSEFGPIKTLELSSQSVDSFSKEKKKAGGIEFYFFFSNSFFRISYAFRLASSEVCFAAFAASSKVLLVMFLGFPMSLSGFPHPQL